MSKSFRFGSVVLTIALSAAVPAFAATITLSDGYGNGPGGEFNASPTGLAFVPVDFVTGVAGQFGTFCVEKNEYITFGSTYYVDVSTAAVGGGVGGGSPDPLDSKTAYLYERFATGNLANYTYGVGDGGIARAASADALQHVIWYLENEESKVWTDGDNSLMDKYYQNALTNAGPGIGNVRVLNLWGDSTRQAAPAQDQLVLVPEPATTLLAVVGVGLLGWTRRRQ
jgi:hypothetical protein